MEKEEIVKQKRMWMSQDIWNIGVETPYGVNCCLRGCSSGELDLDCPCEDNETVRNKIILRVQEIGFVPHGTFSFSILYAKDPELLLQVIHRVDEIVRTRWKL